jgi:putative intracellular protease/amidase
MTAILMVVPSYSKLPNGAATGLWLEELAASYWVLVDAACTVALASPEGGEAPVDPLSLEEPWLTAAGKRFRGDAAAMKLLTHTLRLDAIDATEWQGIYLVGGAATAWDYPASKPLARLVSELYSKGHPVAGVCHGVLGLAAARNAAGAPIVAGHSITGISNAEETLTGFDKIVPVLPESRLRELGGRYSCAAPFESHVVADGMLLSGQNPASAGPLAQALLTALAAAPRT